MLTVLDFDVTKIEESLFIGVFQQTKRIKESEGRLSTFGSFEGHLQAAAAGDAVDGRKGGNY